MNPLAAALAAHRSAGKPVIDLTESNPTRALVPYPVNDIRTALGGAASVDYEPSPFGLPAARQRIAELWASRGISVDSENVALVSSTSEAYSVLFKLLCDAGDEVLVPAPSYPLFEHLARYESVSAVPYRLEYDGAWHLDLASLSARVTSRSRAIVVVNPNNPTGSYVKRDELARVAELGLPIISDEVFGEYWFRTDARRPRSALEATTGALVFALDGLSKHALLPQMKLAWMTVGGPRAAVSESLDALELLLDTFLSPNVPVQHALPVLLDTSAGPRDHVRERTRRNSDFATRVAADTATTVLDVEGGWYAVVRLPNVRSEEQWVLGLVADCDVLVQPGWFYDFGTEPYAVVSLLTPEPVFEDGFARLVDYARSAR
jgi:aspartate/methionine/tyrosine aminotransferase